MRVPLPKLLPALLILGVSCVSAWGCGDDEGNDEPNLTGPSVIETMRYVAVEPAVVTPEFLASPGCRTRPPYAARFSLVVWSNDDIVIQGADFHFVDRLGARSIPTLLPTHSGSTVPIPTTLRGLPVPGGGSRTLPFALQFPCGVASAGTLFIAIQTVDGRGTRATSQTSVRIEG